MSFFKKFRKKYKLRRLLRGKNLFYAMAIADAIQVSWPEIKKKLETAKDEAGNDLLNDPEILGLYHAVRGLAESLKR